MFTTDSESLNPAGPLAPDLQAGPDAPDVDAKEVRLRLQDLLPRLGLIRLTDGQRARIGRVGGAPLTRLGQAALAFLDLRPDFVARDIQVGLWRALVERDAAYAQAEEAVDRLLDAVERACAVLAGRGALTEAQAAGYGRLRQARGQISKL